ncbi:hypothetical protein [Acidomonas methanolica]|uniref:hypothetical protein n=1 Tax=Acidomonas methanolica TaxID=437 RepID=UPI002119D972|nr:hypothetical protein [Acidomonas methanolica]MCQ9155134.1 hypothetical protein [Acidomonas methanolica]
MRIAVICFVAWDIAHELLQDKPSMTRLGVSIVSDIFQAVAATYIGWIAGTAIAMVFVDGIIITFIAVSGASFFAGMGMSIFDSQFHVTKKALELAKTIDISKVIDSFVDFSNRINKNYILSHRSAYTYFSY